MTMPLGLVPDEDNTLSAEHHSSDGALAAHGSGCELQPLPAGKPFRLGYRPALDGARGISILLVLGVHEFSTYMPGGYLGVDVFFVLSGFLITSLLLSEWADRGNINLKSFYVRRALRLVPALVVVLIVWSIYTVVIVRESPMWVAWTSLAVLFYSANIVIAYTPFSLAGLTPAWSLSAEEQFYLLWPFALSVLLWRKVSLGKIAIVLVAVSSLVAILRILVWNATHDWERIYFAPDTHADPILIGCLVAILVHLVPGLEDRTPPLLFRVLFLASIGLVASCVVVMTHETSLQYYGGLTVISIAMGIIVAGLVWSPPAGVLWLLETGALVWIGRLSYSLYLWHLPIFKEFSRLTADCPLRWSVEKMLMFGAAFAAAALSYYLVERPFLRLKNRFEFTAGRAAGLMKS